MTEPVSELAYPIGDQETWNTELDVEILAQRVRLCREAQENEKGKLLEDLLVWLLAHVPGFTVGQPHIWSQDGSQELDLLVWNEQAPPGVLPSFGDCIIVECKNWSGKVGSAEIAWMAWKLMQGHVETGILVAANGVTGSTSAERNGHSVMWAANREGYRILLVTLDDIDVLTSTEDFVRLLKRRKMALAAKENPLDY